MTLTLHLQHPAPRKRYQWQRRRQGEMRPQGASDEVSIAAAIAGASANRNGVSTLDTPCADPDIEVLRQKMNETILAI